MLKFLETENILSKCYLYLRLVINSGMKKDQLIKRIQKLDPFCENHWTNYNYYII